MFLGFGLLYIVIVGLIAGWATGKIMKGAGYGVLVDILLGIAGAIIGNRILAMLGIFTTGGLIPSILVARAYRFRKTSKIKLNNCTSVIPMVT
jgi:uncharacterized membrane protein YeaQ/YmgE (transglycosylase-associated protein family)